MAHPRVIEWTRQNTNLPMPLGLTQEEGRAYWDDA